MKMKTKMKTNDKLPEVTNVDNGGELFLGMAAPYDVEVTISGDSPILFHAYNVESVEAKSKAKKGSEAKKLDDVESYVYRNEEGYLCVPGLNLCAAMAKAAKRHRDPSSSRKCAEDLVKAVVFPVEMYYPFVPKIKEWDFLDGRRVTVNHSAVTRVRPGLAIGWKIKFRLRCVASDLLPPEFLYQLVREAGMFQGLCDYRPTFGRFSIHKWEVK